MKKLKYLLAFLISCAFLSGCTPATDTGLTDVSPDEAFTIYQQNEGNPNFIILDVRTPEEFAEQHISGAINIDYYEESFRDEIDQLDKTKIYLIYCGVGGRSSSALSIMEELGFQEAYNLEGGIGALTGENFELTSNER